MKKFFCILGILIACPFFARADITIVGPILTNATWSPDNGVYVLQGSVTVPSGVTLTIAPGTIIKSKIGGGGVLSVYGTLNASGTGDMPIHFTSHLNDAIGGDTNNDATSTTPMPGDWQGIIFQSGSTGNLSYIDLTYAGHGGPGYGDYSGIENLGGTLVIANSTISNNGVYGIYNKLGSLSVDQSSIGLNDIGIMIESGTSTISHSTIQNNRQYGLFNDTGSDPLVLTDNTFTGNARTAIITPALEFTHTGNTSNDIAYKGFQIIADKMRDGTVLNSVDLPLLMFGMLKVPVNKSLTIAPGTVIKFGTGAGVLVEGTLIANGTAGQRIEFTALKDDTIAGDTNGDGSASLPDQAIPADNWTGVVFNPGASGGLSYTNIHYGGAYGAGPSDAAVVYNLGTSIALDHVLIENAFREGVYQLAGTTTASNLELRKNQIGVNVGGGIFSINNSQLHDNNEFGIRNNGSPPVDARYNWWGKEDGPTDMSTTTPTGSGDKISKNVLYVPWLTTISEDTGSSSPATSTPATLYGTSTPVIVVPGILGSMEKDGAWILDPILHTYDNLLDTLRANGYTDELTLFTLPYDWRQSNVVTAGLLKAKIEAVKIVCQCDKVNVVAHSMGGLAASYYMESSGYGHDINQMIFLGTPHKGAATDYLAWEGGRIGQTIQDKITELYLGHQAKENGFSNLYEYVKGYPIVSVKELLPITDYLHKVGYPVKTYPIEYPRNEFLEDLESRKVSMLASGTKFRNYVGDTGMSTISSIRVTDSPDPALWVDGYPDGFDSFLGDHGLEFGEGDGTVPLSSAQFLDTGDVVVSAGHRDIPTVVEAQVVEDLTGTSTDITIQRSLPERFLIAQVFSPADISIVAPDGKRVGTDPATGLEVNEISGAYYSGGDAEEEFITIPEPEDGEYKVESLGTGTGSYTVLLAQVSDIATQSVTYTLPTNVGAKGSKTFTLSDEVITPVVAPPITQTPSVPASLSAPGSSRRTLQKPIIISVQVPSSTPILKFVKTINTQPVISNTLVKNTLTTESPDTTANAYQGASKLSVVWHRFSGWLKNLFSKVH